MLSLLLGGSFQAEAQGGTIQTKLCGLDLVEFKRQIAPTITFLGIHSGEMKTYVHSETCTQIYISAFILSYFLAQLKCPSMGEWLKLCTSI